MSVDYPIRLTLGFVLIHSRSLLQIENSPAFANPTHRGR